MTDDAKPVLRLVSAQPAALRYYGVSRMAANDQAILVSFSRPLTDDEMRFFGDVCARTAPLMPRPAP